MKKTFSQKGFTLIEMLISMGIFVVFMGVLLNSYTYVIKAQREANDYRLLYSEARRVFDVITEEVRENAVYYYDPIPLIGETDSLKLLSKDGTTVKEFSLNDDGVLRLGEAPFKIEHRVAFDDIVEPLVQGEMEYYSLMTANESGGGVNIETIVFKVYPGRDPYLDSNVMNNGIQFHPQVTVEAKFKMEKRGAGDPYYLYLRTTISSRLYSSI